MAEIRVARGGTLDVFFNTLTEPGGNLTDDDDWVDGLTAGQWPSVTVKTQGGSPIDVTASVAKDIAADTIADASHKHPDTETGIWRLAPGPGQYAFRANPQNILTLGNYDITFRYDVNGQVYQETHTLVIVAAGDVEVGGSSVYVTAAEVLANFEIADLVTSVEVDLARATADRMVNAYLDADGISFPRASGSTGWSALKTAAIAFARAELRRLKAVGTGMATGLRRITEADVTYDFVSGDSQFKALHEEGAFWMDLAIKAILGSVFFKVGTIGRSR